MVGIAGYGWTSGDPMLLITPFDPDGLGCGLNETTKDYPFLYFPMIDASILGGAASSAASGETPSISVS